MSDNIKKSNRQYACQKSRKYLGGDISKHELFDSFPDCDGDVELTKLYNALENEPKVRWFFGVTKEKHKEYILEVYKLIDKLEK